MIVAPANFLNSEMITNVFKKFITNHPSAMKTYLGTFYMAEIESIGNVHESRHGFILTLGKRKYKIFITVEEDVDDSVGNE